MDRRAQWTLVSILFVGGLGCGGPDETGPAPSADQASAADYLMSERPPEALGVIEARENAQDGEQVSVTGRIGGSEEPWVEDRAAFTLVDLSLSPCNDDMEERCPTPWDYCCESELPKARVLVKVVDANEQVVREDARTFFGLKELQQLTVLGTATRDEAGNLSILARQIHINQP
jgi:hypothetical protein